MDDLDAHTTFTNETLHTVAIGPVHITLLNLSYNMHCKKASCIEAHTHIQILTP